MKVILTKDERPLGLEGDAIDVANGFGRNYLIPRGIAVLADPGNIRRYQVMRKKLEQKRGKQKQTMQETASKLENKVITIAMEAGEKNILYGSVTPVSILEALQPVLKEEGISPELIDKHSILLPKPIKEIGQHTVTLALWQGVSAAIQLNVEIKKKKSESPKDKLSRPRRRRKKAVDSEEQTPS